MYFLQLLFIFFLSSCSNLTKRLKIAYQNTFLPDSLIKTFPRDWGKEAINFKDFASNKYLELNLSSDLLLVNDGWINSLDFKNFNIIDPVLFNKLDLRAKEYLNSFDDNKQNKIFPIGVLPYVVIIKNNEKLQINSGQSWDFLLEKKLKGKIILPESPRLIISIAERCKDKNSLKKLLNQEIIYDDKNALNRLVDSEALLAVMPYSFSHKYIKIDSRLSYIFPKHGVPLLWNFILSKSKSNDIELYEWIVSLEKNLVVNKLRKEGWFLPFANEYIQNSYFFSDNVDPGNSMPTKECWLNSWSFAPLDNLERIDLETKWKDSLIP